MRDFLKNTAALAIGLLLSAGLLEIGLRLANFSYRPWFRRAGAGGLGAALGPARARLRQVGG